MLAILVATQGLLSACSTGSTGSPGEGTHAQVLIYDDRIEPVEVHVPPGSTVDWADAGARQHHVASDGGGFDPFDLAAGAHHEAPFGQPGRFPYAVDHELHGVIVVDAATAADPASPAPPPESADAEPGTRIEHYAVKLTATAHHLRTVDGQDKSLDDNTEDWTGAWKDVALAITTSPDGVTRIYPSGGDGSGSTGELTATVDYHLVTPPSRGNDGSILVPGVDCVDRLTGTYAAPLSVSGVLRPEDTDIEIDAYSSEPAGPGDPRLRQEHQRRCGNVGTAWTGRREFPVEPGLTFEVTPETLAVKVHREHGDQVLPPLDSILAHRAFELTTGPQQEFHDEPRSSDRSWWNVSLEFTPQ